MDFVLQFLGCGEKGVLAQQLSSFFGHINLKNRENVYWTELLPWPN